MSVSLEDWRENPMAAARKFRELERQRKKDSTLIQKLLGNFQSRDHPWTIEEADSSRIFLDFLEDDDYHSAGLMADTVLKSSPLNFESYAESAALNLIGEDRSEVEQENLKEAFALLDSFNFEKRVGKIEEDSWYLKKEGPDRLIDRVATDIWYGLDGSSQAFFEKYVDEETDAVIYPEEGKKLPSGSFKEAASIAYDEAVKEDPVNAMNIARRFRLGDERVQRAKETQRLNFASERIENTGKLDSGDNTDKKLGNVLTDTYLWRTNPERAQNAGDESLADRAQLVYEGRRGNRPTEDEKREIFRHFMDNGEYHAASMYAEAAGLEMENEAEETVAGLLEIGEPKSAFAVLDEFDLDTRREELEAETPYLKSHGSERLIDQVATQVWKDLEGSARAFFQMYVDDPEERPEDSFEEETMAAVYDPGRQVRRKDDFYKHDAFIAYEELDEDEAEHVSERFGLNF